MDVNSDYFIIKTKAMTWRMMSTPRKVDKSRTFEKCSLQKDRFVQMILVGWKLSFSDCYVQKVSIQMGLLKLIEVNKVFNIWGLCPKWNSWWLWIRNEHFTGWFNKILYCVNRADMSWKRDLWITLADKESGKSWRCYEYLDDYPQWFLS